MLVLRIGARKKRFFLEKYNKNRVIFDVDKMVSTVEEM